MKEIRLPLTQTTLSKPVSFSGTGLFTGEETAIRMLPAPAGSGISFIRVDLPGSPEIRADLDNIRQTPRCTLLSNGSASVQMVEHLLSAISGLGLDNVRIEVEGPEIPAGDGSAAEFVHLIDEVGIHGVNEEKKVLVVSEPIYWSEGSTHLVALPSPEFRISYTLHYPQSPLIRSQFFSEAITPELYRSELASSRTFSLYEEILPFIQSGHIKGGGLDNALVVHGDRVLNPGGSRFSDEMVRHKVLDMIGDLSLIGAAVQGHIISIRSGHATNAVFAKMLREAFYRTTVES